MSDVRIVHAALPGRDSYLAACGQTDGKYYIRKNFHSVTCRACLAWLADWTVQRAAELEREQGGRGTA